MLSLEMKALRVHRHVTREIESLDPFTRRKLAELLALLTEGENLGLPISLPLKKKTEATPRHEIEIAKRRLEEML